MHLLVLSAFRPVQHAHDHRFGLQVSMHLLVLSAFRHLGDGRYSLTFECLNAPSGAQCFPTKEDALMNTIDMSLNAPSGAQCFPTGWEAACVG